MHSCRGISLITGPNHRGTNWRMPCFVNYMLPPPPTSPNTAALPVPRLPPVVGAGPVTADRSDSGTLRASTKRRRRAKARAMQIGRGPKLGKRRRPGNEAGSQGVNAGYGWAGSPKE